MGTLLLRGALPDLADFVNRVGLESYAFASLLLVYILFSSLTVLNMLVGVLCEVVSVVSAVEKEQMTVQLVKTKLMEIIDQSGVDEDGNKCISKSEFEALLLMPEGAKIIEEVGVDVVGLVDFMDDIFRDVDPTQVHQFNVVLFGKGVGDVVAGAATHIHKDLAEFASIPVHLGFERFLDAVG